MSMRDHVISRLSCSVSIGMLLGGFALTASATDWQFNPKIEAGVQANDNYRLLPPGFEDKVYGVFTNAAFEFRYLDPINDFNITPAVYANYLPGTTADDTTDPSVTLNWLRTGQTYKGGLYAQYIRQSVVDANQTTVSTIGNQLGNPVAGDSGYISVYTKRQLEEVSPTFTIDLTQRRHLAITADYQNVTYDPVIIGFNDSYSTENASIGLVQDFTARSSATLRARIEQFNPDGDLQSVRSYGLEGQWDYHLSQISQAYVRVGAQRSFFEDVTGLPHVVPSTGVVAGAGVNWTFQITQLFVDFTRTVEPNSTGYTVNRDQFRLTLNRSLSPTLTAVAAARYVHDAATASTAVFATRDYGLASLGMKWRFRRAWTLNGEYDFTAQHYASVPPVHEHSNAILLSVIYEPNRVS